MTENEVVEGSIIEKIYNINERIDILTSALNQHAQDMVTLVELINQNFAKCALGLPGQRISCEIKKDDGK